MPGPGRHGHRPDQSPAPPGQVLVTPRSSVAGADRTGPSNTRPGSGPSGSMRVPATGTSNYYARLSARDTALTTIEADLLAWAERPPLGRWSLEAHVALSWTFPASLLATTVNRRDVDELSTTGAGCERLITGAGMVAGLGRQVVPAGDPPTVLSAISVTSAGGPGRSVPRAPRVTSAAAPPVAGTTNAGLADGSDATTGSCAAGASI